MGCQLFLTGLLTCCLAAYGQGPCSRGRLTADLVEAEMGPWELSLLTRQEAVAAADPAAKAYVAALGRTLAAGKRVEFLVYDDDLPLRTPWYGVLPREPGVFRSLVRVLPGGVVLVPLSLFDGAATEAEFAAALARGIGHVLLRHFERFVSITGIPVWRVPPPRLWRLTPPFTETRIFPRSLEMEADCAAAAILARAWFEPRALIGFIRNPAVSFDPSRERVEEAAKSAAMLPARSHSHVDSDVFQRLKQGLKRTRPLPAPGARAAV